MVALLIVAVVVECAPLNAAEKSVEIVRYEYENFPDNSYRFVYETSDGQFKDEFGSFRVIGDKLVLAITGSYGYVGDDGKTYTVRYTSNEKGYRASGDHLPKTNTEIEILLPQHLPANIIATLSG